MKMIAHQSDGTNCPAALVANPAGVCIQLLAAMIQVAEISVPAATTVRMSGSEIKALREKNHISQAVFATYLQVTADFVSKLERDEKKPTGPTLVLLNVIRRKGLEAIL